MVQWSIRTVTGVTVVQDVPLCKQCKYGRGACVALSIVLPSAEAWLWRPLQFLPEVHGRNSKSRHLRLGTCLGWLEHKRAVYQLPHETDQLSAVWQAHRAIKLLTCLQFSSLNLAKPHRQLLSWRNKIWFLSPSIHATSVPVGQSWEMGLFGRSKKNHSTHNGLAKH